MPTERWKKIRFRVIVTSVFFVGVADEFKIFREIFDQMK